MGGWLPHADDDLVCAHPTRTAADLRADVAAVVRALGPPSPGRERTLAVQGRYAFLVALLALWERGEVARLPSSLAPEAVRAVAGPDGALHDGAAEDTDLRPLLSHGDGRAALPLPSPSTPLVRLTTSGSTGEPRTLEKSAGQLLGEADTLRATFGLSDGVRLVATVPPHHIYGLLFGLLVPLRAGGVLHDDAPLLVEAVAARVAELGAQVLVSVPAHLRGLVADGPNPFQGLLRIVSSGAPLPPETAEAVHARAGLEVTEVFGSTETGGIAWRQQRTEPRWRPLPGVTVGADPDGRLLLDSPFLAADEPRPRPGDDRVDLGADGLFAHLGRLDDVVKIASRRVSLGGVERALLGAPGVVDGAVALRTDGGRERLHALVVLDGAPGPVRAWLADRLDAVAIPRLHPVDRLPREATGKLPRARLLAALDAVLGTAPAELHLVQRVPHDHPGFAGHFPDAPVLPAVVQLLDLVLPAVAETWPDLDTPHELRRLKFLHPVRPGDAVGLHAVRDGTTVRFTLSVGEVTAASGSLLAAAPTGRP